MKAFYINLDSRTDRRESIERQLSSIGFSYQRFPALADSDAYRFPELDLGMRNITPSWSSVKFRENRAPGEWGCSLSHYAILKSYRGHDEEIAIFEDDAVFSEDFRERYQAIRFDGSWDILYLSAFCNLKQNTKIASGELYYLNDGMFCSHAMVFNTKSIPKILDIMRHVAPMAAAVDLIYSYVSKHAKVVFVCPGMVRQLGTGDISGIKDITEHFSTMFGDHVFCNKKGDTK